MSKKMKILLINRWVGYNEGGNETHMQGLIEWFTKIGNEVHVITTRGDILNKFPNVRKIYINTPQGYYSYGPFGLFYATLFNIKAFVALVKLHFSGERYDLVSVHFSLEAALARFIKIFFGYPYVMLMAGDTLLELTEGKRADGAIHISHFMNEQSIKMGYSAAVIPKGFELERFNPNVDTTELKKLHKISSQEKVLLTVCRLDPRKNLITLIEAMDVIINERNISDLKLLIVGDGVERQFLEDAVSKYKLDNYITFIGKLPNKSPLLPQYYALADLFVLPTLYEGFGWVYYESMACGTPVLTTKAGSNLEVVGDAGILIEPKDSKLLANAIINTVYDSKLLEKLKEKGFKKATSIPWEKQIQKYNDYYYKTSQNKCHGPICKLKVLGYIIIDAFSIVANTLKGSIFNNVGQTWQGKGQSGIN